MLWRADAAHNRGPKRQDAQVRAIFLPSPNYRWVVHERVRCVGVNDDIFLWLRQGLRRQG